MWKQPMLVGRDHRYHPAEGCPRSGCSGRGARPSPGFVISVRTNSLLENAANYDMIRGMEKFFNTAGPCYPAEHYMLPALDRLPEIRQLVAQRRYFVIHAPRQTGKTTALKALAREINAKDDMVALYCTLETLQNAKDPARAATVIASLLRVQF